MVLNIFKRKKEEKKEEIKKSIGTCFVCNNSIFEGEDYKTVNFQNQKFLIHKKCFRQMKKIAKQYIKGNIKLPK